MLDNNNYSGARSRLQELKRQAPNDPDVAGLYLDLASNLQIDGQVDQAKRAYQQYLDMRPNGSRASEVRSILDRL
jgi:Flp pilus assembly protein TadD